MEIPPETSSAPSQPEMRYNPMFDYVGLQFSSNGAVFYFPGSVKLPVEDDLEFGLHASVEHDASTDFGYLVRRLREELLACSVASFRLFAGHTITITTLPHRIIDAEYRPKLGGALIRSANEEYSLRNKEDVSHRVFWLN
jgi:hypothetical protein